MHENREAYKGAKRVRGQEEYQSSKQDSAFVTVLPPFSAKFWPTLRIGFRAHQRDAGSITFLLTADI
jgi:hypothetical protein